MKDCLLISHNHRAFLGGIIYCLFIFAMIVSCSVVSSEDDILVTYHIDILYNESISAGCRYHLTYKPENHIEETTTINKDFYYQASLKKGQRLYVFIIGSMVPDDKCIANIHIFSDTFSHKKTIYGNGNTSFIADI